MKLIKIVSIGSISLLSSTQALAHINTHAEVEDSIQVRGSMTFRTDSIVEQNEAWILPGFLMGGHALPSQDGFELDEVSVSGAKTFDKFWVQGQVSRHSGHEQIDIDHFFITVPFEHELQLQFGQMPGLSTPLMQWHTSVGAVADMPLLTSVFFGGHTQDQGVRLMKHFDSNTTLGVEVWQGNDWPSTSDENPVSAFLKQSFTLSNISFDLGAWYMQSAATSRMDDRYGDDHHSTVTPVNAAYMFTGDVDTGGVYADATTVLFNHVLSFHGEYIMQEHDGVLSDTSESSSLNSQITGYLFELNLNNVMTFGYELLSVENTFGSSVSTTFLNNSGLYNQGFEPERFYVSWQKPVFEGLDYRITLIQETLEPEEDELRFNIGATWVFDVI